MGKNKVGKPAHSAHKGANAKGSFSPKLGPGKMNTYAPYKTPLKTAKPGK